MGGVAVPKTVQKNALPREDVSEIPVEGVAVPKTGQKNALPREDATETTVGGVAVPKTGYDTGKKPCRDRRGDGAGVAVVWRGDGGGMALG